MANEISLFRDKNAALPAAARGVDEITKALMGGSSIGKRISILGGVWRMIAGGEEIAKNEDRNLDVVIVNAAAKTSRSYYKGTYSEESKGQLPDCWSNDGIKPDPKSEAPQASACANCPMNVAGSGQGTSRACRFHRRVAVVLANNIEQGEVFQLVLPSQSIFGKAEDGKMPLEAYARFIGGHGLSINSVVTELKFDTSSATPKIVFRAVRPLTEDEMDAVIEHGQSQDAINAITFNPAQTDRQGAAEKPAAETKKVEKKTEVFRDEPAAEPKAKKTKTAPAPVEEPEEEETPQVRSKTKPAEEPNELAAVLGAWGDDDDED